MSVLTGLTEATRALPEALLPLEHAVETNVAGRAGVGCRCNSDPDLGVAAGRNGGAARIDAIPVDGRTDSPSLSRVLGQRVHHEREA
jgi:hypothetical protein